MVVELRQLLTEILNLGNRGNSLTANSPLLGEIPELDSMAVVTIITTIEDQYEIEFDDDEITAETFDNLGTLAALVESKIEIS